MWMSVRKCLGGGIVRNTGGSGEALSGPIVPDPVPDLVPDLITGLMHFSALRWILSTQTFRIAIIWILSIQNVGALLLRKGNDRHVENNSALRPFSSEMIDTMNVGDLTEILRFSKFCKICSRGNLFHDVQLLCNSYRDDVFALGSILAKVAILKTGNRS